LALLALAGLAAAGPLENVRTGSWIYSSIDVLKTAGLIRSVPSTSRPWTRAYAARLVKEAIDSPHVPISGFLTYHVTRLAGEFLAELGLTAATGGLRRARPLFRITADSTLVVGVDPSVRAAADIPATRTHQRC
jgi:hypothetical protein